MGFLESGWSIRNGLVTYPSVIDGWTAWKFVQEAIYDGHIPVVKAIGYDPSNPRKGGHLDYRRYTKRFPGCAEDRFTLVANFSKLLFLVDSNVKRVYIREGKGKIVTDNAVFVASTKPVNVLSTSSTLFTALDRMSVELAVAIGTGYVTPDENYEKLRNIYKYRVKTKMFPMYSSHSLIDFVRIIPYAEDGVIRLRYDHGMTDEVLEQLFIRMFEMKMDRNWLQKYEGVITC